MESLAAVLTGIGARVAVYQQMRGESRRPLEALAALRTREAPLVRVDGAVLTETDGVSKRLTAYVTRIRPPPPAVRPTHVHLETVRRREAFRARQTAVDVPRCHHVTVRRGVAPGRRLGLSLGGAALDVVRRTPDGRSSSRR